MCSHDRDILAQCAQENIYDNPNQKHYITDGTRTGSSCCRVVGRNSRGYALLLRNGDGGIVISNKDLSPVQIDERNAALAAKRKAARKEANHRYYVKNSANMTPEQREKVNAAQRKKNRNNGMSAFGSDDHRTKLSCALRGITLNEFNGFAKDEKSPYCPKFNDACRERNRAKYGRTCFICGKTETENGKRLSVHHVDLNKQQGCDNHVWHLVPLCASCHSSAHNDTTQTRIEYLLGEL